MNRNTTDVIQAILEQMGFRTYLQSTHRVESPAYDANDNEVVIEGLFDVNGHEVNTGM